MLVNGTPGNLIGIRDRGLLYGDGVFRTMRVVDGKLQHWSLHYQKIRHDCESLAIDCPDFSLLTDELSGLLLEHPDAVYKLIVTRGLSVRGYAPPLNSMPTHIWDVAPLPAYSLSHAMYGLTLRLCELRLGHQPRLAGIKHLNRLENVLAASEFAAEDGVDEGLLLDVGGRVIEGIRSNIFIKVGHGLLTPDLSRCGVAGVQRDRVIAYAEQIGMPIEIKDVMVSELFAANEIFLCNSVFGVLPVARFGHRRWTEFAFTMQVRAGLELE